MKTAPDLALFFLKFWYKSIYFYRTAEAKLAVEIENI